MKQDLIQDIMMAFDGMLSAEKLGIAQNKLAYIMANYNVEFVGTEIATQDDLLPMCYKAYMVSQKINGLSLKTLDNYGYILRDFIFSISKPIDKVTTNDIRAYIYKVEQTRKNSNRTLDRKRSVISSFLEWCANEGYIDKNPGRNLKAIKYQVRERDALTQDELEMLRMACKNMRELALIEFLYATGCRVSECTSVKVSDIDFNDRSLKVIGKGNKERRVYLNAKSVLSIKSYLQTRKGESEYLFCSNKAPHGQLSVDCVQKVLNLLGQRAGIERKIHPHLFRHTTAKVCLSRGMRVEDIQMLLGHSNINTTMIYAKTSQEKVQMEHKRCVV